MNKAIEKGYRLVKIYEVYHWDKTTKYNTYSTRRPVFREGRFLFEAKATASGWFALCDTNKVK